MNPPLGRPLSMVLGVMAWLLAGAAQAQGLAPGVYRCGDSYGSTPCPGGKPVEVDDNRSDDQRRQAQAVKDQDARLAAGLAAERRARERAAIGQRAARLGPSDAERARAETLPKRDKTKAEPESQKKKPKREPRKPKNA